MFVGGHWICSVALREGLRPEPLVGGCRPKGCPRDDAGRGRSTQCDGSLEREVSGWLVKVPVPSIVWMPSIMWMPGIVWMRDPQTDWQGGWLVLGVI